MTETNPYRATPLPPPAAYGQPAASSYGPRRPGAISFIGTMSIIVASLSCLGSLIGGCEARIVYMATRISKTMASSGSAMTNLPPPGAQTTAAPNGLKRSDCQVAAAVLTAMEEMTSDQRRQLDAFLAEQGTSAFPTLGQSLTDKRVTRAVTSHFQHLGGGDADPAFTAYVTRWGTLKVYELKADFQPAGEGSAVSVTASDVPPVIEASPPSPGPVGVSSGHALTAAQVEGAMQRAQQATGNKLNAAQSAALQTALRNPNQQLVATGTEYSPVRMANIGADGSAVVVFSEGYADLTPQGQITINAYNAPGAAPKFDVSNTAITLATLDALATLGLAILLFIAAAAVLRQSPSGRKLHLLYVFLKIPLAVAGTAALAWMNNQLVGAAANGTGAAAAQQTMMYWMIALGALGLAYPVLLLFVLYSRGVRTYYAAVER